MGETNTNETPVPPGWVRLTPRECAATLLVRASKIVCVIGASSGSDVTVDGRPEGEDAVAESPAEVAALIAEADAAERRANALPVMAAILFPAAMDLVIAGNDKSSTDIALGILDAIERIGEAG